MHCLYCKKRLWLIFSKDRVFCSKLHEAAYHDELSAMNRLMEFTVPVDRQALPAPRNRTLSEIYRESTINWALSVAAPPLYDLLVEPDRPKPIPPDPAAALRLDAVPFARSIQFPSSNSGVIALVLDSATETGGEIATRANETIGACRLRSKHSRRMPSRGPAAFSLRTHRRKVK
jgi:hypothetical protein